MESERKMEKGERMGEEGNGGEGEKVRMAEIVAPVGRNPEDATDGAGSLPAATGVARATHRQTDSQRDLTHARRLCDRVGTSNFFSNSVLLVGWLRVGCVVQR